MYPSSHSVQVEVMGRKSSSLVFFPLSDDRQCVADQSVSCYIPESKSDYIQHRTHPFPESVEGTDFKTSICQSADTGFKLGPEPLLDLVLSRS